VSAPTIAPKTPKIPTNGDELTAFLTSDDAKPYLKDATSLADFMENYAKASFKGPDRDQINEQITARLTEMLKDESDSGEGIKRLNMAPGNHGEQKRRMMNRVATGYNDSAIGAALDDQFDNSADYFKSVWQMDGKRVSMAPSAVVDKMTKIQNAYSSAVPADGGFLIPEALRASLLSVALENSIVRPRATVVPMESAKVPFPIIDSTTNDGSVMGGMVAYWTEEGADFTASSAKFGRVNLDAKKLTGYAEVPSELMQDSIISFAAFIDSAWPKALAFFEDQAYISGTGVGEPLGFLGSSNPAGVAVTKESGQAAATLLTENIVKMYARMLPTSLNTAVWLVTPDLLPELFTMALSVGTGGSAVYLTGGIQGAPTMTILGRPVIVTEKVSVAGTRGDIAFVDLSYYLIGDRQTMSADTSDQFKFGSHKTAFRIIQRVDGRPWIQSAITPANGGPTLTPFVELETRA
jgi:HK97 family phage major capsid protein